MKPWGHDGEVTRPTVCFPVGVRLTGGNKDGGSRRSLDLVIAKLEGQAPFEYMPGLIILVVKMEEGGTAATPFLYNEP